MDEVGVQKEFHHAVHMGDVTAVKRMLAVDPSLATSTDEYLFQPIHLMDMYFEVEILDLLVANGADVNTRNDEGVTILHIVTDPEAVKHLLDRGSDIEARDVRGWTPLIMQANEGENGPDVVAALLAGGADPTAAGKQGETALAFATERGDDELASLLKASGARQ